VPVACLEDRSAPGKEFVDKSIERLNDFVAMCNSQRAAWAEIILNVDDEECLLLHTRHMRNSSSGGLKVKEALSDMLQLVGDRRLMTPKTHTDKAKELLANLSCDFIGVH
jgi:hypothetical protein